MKAQIISIVTALLLTLILAVPLTASAEQKDDYKAVLAPAQPTEQEAPETTGETETEGEAETPPTEETQLAEESTEDTITVLSDIRCILLGVMLSTCFTAGGLLSISAQNGFFRKL